MGYFITPEKFLSEVYFVAVRSSGPGGQNVNKVSSAAQLYWSVEHSHLFTSEQRSTIAQKLANKINSEGLLYLRSDEFRDLERNKARCLEKLSELVKQALHKPKTRKKTKPTKSSVRKRLQSKRLHSEKKASRKTTGLD